MSKLLCSVCKKFALANHRLKVEGTRNCPHTKRMVSDTKKLPSCDGFEMHPYIWCNLSRGRYSVEICRMSTRRECKKCITGQTIRELLPSKLPPFKSGDWLGLSDTLAKIRTKNLETEIDLTLEHGNNGTRPEKTTIRSSRKPIILPVKVVTVVAKVEKRQRKPIIVRTPKDGATS